MLDKKTNMHIFNQYKLLALIIISACLQVLELTINRGGTRERLFLYEQVPLMVEYLIWSLILLLGGVIIWYIAIRYSEKQK